MSTGKGQYVHVCDRVQWIIVVYAYLTDEVFEICVIGHDLLIS